MIEHTEIKFENGEEVLYCYLNYDYEFGKEFFSNLKEKGIIKQVRDWIYKSRISFHGKKVIIVASGIVVASLLLSENTNQQSLSFPMFSNTIITQVSKVEEPKNMQETKEIESSNQNISNEDHQEYQENDLQETIASSSSSNSETKQETTQSTIETPIQSIAIQNPITIYRNGTPIVLEFEEYIAGVVAAEMPASFPNSALQAQAVLARTYALRRQKEGKILTDSVDTQVYYDENQLKREWGNQYEMYWNKIKQACISTAGQTLQYQGNYIDAVYHSTSNGATEAARNVWGYEVPYLQSVDSHWDFNTTFYHNTVSKDLNQLLQLFNITSLEEGDIEILSRNESGRVSEIRIQNQIYQGVDLRSILNLRSSDFDIKIENGNLIITTKGWGHGVGMSQFGAAGMAKEGYSYDKILAHYYPGTNLSSQ